MNTNCYLCSEIICQKKNVVQSNTWELRLRQRHLEVGFINSDKMEERKIKPTHHATPK
jgi:hypothetical protein